MELIRNTTFRELAVPVLGGTQPVPETSCFLLIPLIFHLFLPDDGHSPEVFNCTSYTIVGTL
jgi:hypothetical protein